MGKRRRRHGNSGTGVKSKEGKAMFSKGALIQSVRTGSTYQIAGKWNGNLVLAPISESDAACLLYQASELQELIDAGDFIKK